MQRPEQQNQIESDDDSSIDVIAIEISDPATHLSKAGVRYETSTDGQSISAVSRGASLPGRAIAIRAVDAND